MRRKIYTMAAVGLLAVLPAAAQDSFREFRFADPDVAGTLRLGLVCGAESVWFDQLRPERSEKEGVVVYTVHPEEENADAVTVMIRELKDTYGIVFKVESRSGKAYDLFWAYGGCSAGEERVGKGPAIAPEDCRDNVFSREGNMFAVYYGTSRRLRLIHGITPLGTETRLCDARRQESPLDLWHSGKKTDAPVVGGITPLEPDEPAWFCIYHRRPPADYNVYMLPELMEKGSLSVRKDRDRMGSSQTNP